MASCVYIVVNILALSALAISLVSILRARQAQQRIAVRLAEARQPMPVSSEQQERDAFMKRYLENPQAIHCRRLI